MLELFYDKSQFKLDGSSFSLIIIKHHQVRQVSSPIPKLCMCKPLVPSLHLPHTPQNISLFCLFSPLFRHPPALHRLTVLLNCLSSSPVIQATLPPFQTLIPISFLLLLYHHTFFTPCLLSPNTSCSCPSNSDSTTYFCPLPPHL